MIVLLLGLILIVITLIKKHYSNVLIAQYLKNIPGPKPLPLLQNTLEFRSKSLFECYNEWFEQFGDTFQREITFVSKAVVTRDPDFVLFILNSPKLLEKGKNYRIIRRWVGNGLLTIGHAQWKNHRKLITRSFNFKMIENSIKIFNSFEKCLMNSLEKEFKKDDGDVISVIKQHTLSAICLSAMGTEVLADNTFFDCINDLFKLFLNRSTSPLKAMDLTFRLTSDYQMEKQCLNVISKYIDFVLNSRKKEIQKTNTLIDLKIDDVGIKQQTSFLDVLLKQQIAYNNFSDKEIGEEVLTFMIAGYETTTTTISFLLYNLAQHPDVQEKVVEELRWIFENDKFRQPSYEDFANMKYFDMVIKESQRIHSAVPLVSRLVNESFTYGDTTFPKGIDLVIPIYFLHRHPKLYENPEQFDPERFTPENIKKRHICSFIPFSFGFRNCVGQKYAILKVKSVICNILRYYEVLPITKDHDLKLDFRITVVPVDGFNFRLKKRDF